jgi:hypothetical protein
LINNQISLDIQLKGVLQEEETLWLAEIPALDFSAVDTTAKKAIDQLMSKIKNLTQATFAIHVKDNKIILSCAFRQEVLDSIIRRSTIIQKQLDEFRQENIL